MSSSSVQFIAEVSSNHNRSLERCFEFIDTAAKVGCDAVKFQLFKIDELFSSEAIAAKPELIERRNWELPHEFLPEIHGRCREMGIKFGCTPFYLSAVDELLPYVDFYKIASYELLWDNLLTACASTGKDVLVSSGMATLEEVVHAADVLRAAANSNVAFFHCTSSYPTPPNETNLAAIETLRKSINCDIGWSDHTVNPAVIYRAVHRWGAKIIEFHLDLEGAGEEFAAGHCWLPDEIQKVIDDVRIGFECDGSNIKKPSVSETSERLWRADPIDGLRPLKATRAQITSEH